MAFLQITVKFAPLRQDAAEVLVRNSDLDTLLGSFRGATVQALADVPELASTVSVDRLDVRMEMGNLNNVGTFPEPDDPTGFLHIVIVAEIETENAYGFALEGSPGRSFIIGVISRLSEVFMSLPDDQAFFERLGFSGDADMEMKVIMDAPWNSRLT